LKLLLDTVTFLWIGAGSSQLSTTARSTIVDPANELLLSAVSAWEIHLKASIGKLSLPVHASEYIKRVRDARAIASIAFDEDDARSLSSLPFHHRDPFDRALVSQAIARSLIILTPDPAIGQYAISALW
jgi:PIN domain nuclease of toxin-antitoxin system